MGEREGKGKGGGERWIRKEGEGPERKVILLVVKFTVRRTGLSACRLIKALKPPPNVAKGGLVG